MQIRYRKSLNETYWDCHVHFENDTADIWMQRGREYSNAQIMSKGWGVHSEFRLFLDSIGSNNINNIRKNI